MDSLHIQQQMLQGTDYIQKGIVFMVLDAGVKFYESFAKNLAKFGASKQSKNPMRGTMSFNHISTTFYAQHCFKIAIITKYLAYRILMCLQGISVLTAIMIKFSLFLSAYKYKNNKPEIIIYT